MKGIILVENIEKTFKDKVVKIRLSVAGRRSKLHTFKTGFKFFNFNFSIGVVGPAGLPHLC